MTADSESRERRNLQSREPYEWARYTQGSEVCGVCGRRVAMDENREFEEHGCKSKVEAEAVN